MNTNQPTKQKVSGIILIDKPQGMTSQQVVSKVKFLFMSPDHNSKKAGHTGTLDPMATGLLPICLGEATKFSQYQLTANKCYEAIIQLGEQTDTGDADGKVTDTKPVPNVIDDDHLASVKDMFLGNIKQIPPMYSALKKDGKKLYEYARAGQEVEREARDLTIERLTLVLLNDTQLKITVSCSKGTYIRVLGEDIAKALGTLGHLIALRRTESGGFHVNNAITLDQLEEMSLTERFEHLLAVDVFLTSLASITIDESQLARIRNGQRLNVYDLIQQEWFTVNDTQMDEIDIKLYDSNGVFIALGLLENSGRLQPKKVLNY